MQSLTDRVVAMSRSSGIRVACGRRYRPAFDGLEIRTLLSSLALAGMRHAAAEEAPVRQTRAHGLSDWSGTVVEARRAPLPLTTPRPGAMLRARHSRAARLAEVASSGGTSVDVHPAGLPMGGQWDIGTRWTQMAASPVPWTALSVSTSAGGTVWQTFGFIGIRSWLTTYNPSTATYTTVWTTEGGITSVAAVSSTKAWVVMSTGQAFAFQYVNGKASTTAAPSLPGGDKFAQISAGSDGTTWAVGTSGTPYVFSSGSGSWTAASNGGAKLTAISVGYAGNIWAIGTVGGGNAQAFRLVNGVFQADPYFDSIGAVAMISATADGTAWAVANGTLYSRPQGVGAWSEVTGQTLPGTINAISGISQYRLNAVIGEQYLELLTYGVADQPATGFPAMDDGETKAYQAISTALGVTAPGGIRSVYTDALYQNSIPDWPALIEAMDTPPDKVSTADWNSMKTQLYTETTYVGYVFALFDQINALTQQIATVASNEVTSVATQVQLSTSNQSEGVQLFLEAMAEAELWAVAAAGLPAGAAVAASAIASGFGSWVSTISGDANPNATTAIDTTEVKLLDQLDTLYTTANTKNGEYENAILSDWGRLATIGLGVHNGSLSWDYATVSKIAATTDQAFDKYFFQTFMPLKWDIAAYKGKVPYYLAPAAPSYAYLVLQNQKVNNNTNYESVVVIHDKNGLPDPFLSPGPFPTQSLLNAIYATGVTKLQLLSGSNGWLTVKYY
ncbi:hypothetical protein [Paludisphaera rhizosphaerae]|uniref:hypothetical protein n=1 Tax=Paludisphaera rhizosphaerae TaxID=2711216 RepID=UPI0013EE3E6F|nr:hypothetical protein [Paludisphaera rhizosphaerae]